MQNTHTLQAGTDIKEKTYNGYGHQLLCTFLSHLFPTCFAYSLVICNWTTWRARREDTAHEKWEKEGEGRRKEMEDQNVKERKDKEPKKKKT